MADAAQQPTPSDPAADAAAALTIRQMRRAYALSPAAVLDKMRDVETAMRLAAATAYDHREDDLCRQINDAAHAFRDLIRTFAEKHRRPEEPHGIY